MLEIYKLTLVVTQGILDGKVPSIYRHKGRRLLQSYNWMMDNKLKNNLARAHNRFVVSICGGSGSGKSTLAKCIYENLGSELAARIPTDFYLKSNRFTSLEEFFKHPLEYDWELIDAALQEKDGEILTAPDYDFVTFQRITLQGTAGRGARIGIDEGQWVAPLPADKLTASVSRRAVAISGVVSPPLPNRFPGTSGCRASAAFASSPRSTARR